MGYLFINKKIYIVVYLLFLLNILYKYLKNKKIEKFDIDNGGLDHETGEKVLSLLFDLHKDSKSTLVLVTHDERVAERCQHRVRMDGGRLYAS